MSSKTKYTIVLVNSSIQWIVYATDAEEAVKALREIVKNTKPLQTNDERDPRTGKIFAVLPTAMVGDDKYLATNMTQKMV